MTSSLPRKLGTVVFGLACLGLFAADQPGPGRAGSPPATAPADPSSAVLKKNSPVFLQRHEAFLRRGKEAPIGLLFLGDSITEFWCNAHAVWAQHYWPYMPANFGISGDRTENVIWRIENGELDGIRPRVVVFMLGTNNTGSNTAAQIAAADRKIVGMIRAKIPGVRVLLLAVFPRGPHTSLDGTFDDGVKRMAVIADVNKELARLDDGRNVRFLNIGAKFLGSDGKIPDSVMPDHLHPSVDGYRIWADAIQPLLDEMMR